MLRCLGPMKGTDMRTKQTQNAILYLSLFNSGLMSAIARRLQHLKVADSCCNNTKPLILDGPIRAKRFADSRESPDPRESFQGSRTEPLFANRKFEAIRANRSHVMKIVFFFFVNRFARIARFALRIAGPSKPLIAMDICRL